MLKLKGLKDEISAAEIASILSESYPDDTQEIEFEIFLKVNYTFVFLMWDYQTSAPFTEEQTDP